MKEYETQGTLGTPTNSYNGWTFFSMLMFLAGMFGATFMYVWISKNPTVKTEVQTQIVYDITDPFTEEKALAYIKELHIKYPRVALAQMKLESANGTSKIFKEGNNLFGMQHPRIRATTSLGIRNNHSYYSHWRQSIIDYALFQNFVSNAENLETEEAWLNYISHMYAEDNKYKQKILNIINAKK